MNFITNGIYSLKTSDENASLILCDIIAYPFSEKLDDLKYLLKRTEKLLVPTKTRTTKEYFTAILFSETTPINLHQHIDRLEEKPLYWASYMSRKSNN